MTCGELTRLISSVFGGCHLFLAVPSRQKDANPPRIEREKHTSTGYNRLILFHDISCACFRCFFLCLRGIVAKKRGMSLRCWCESVPIPIQPHLSANGWGWLILYMEVSWVMPAVILHVWIGFSKWKPSSELGYPHGHGIPPIYVSNWKSDRFPITFPRNGTREVRNISCAANHRFNRTVHLS